MTMMGVEPRCSRKVSVSPRHVYETYYTMPILGHPTYISILLPFDVYDMLMNIPDVFRRKQEKLV